MSSKSFKGVGLGEGFETLRLPEDSYFPGTWQLFSDEDPLEEDVSKSHSKRTDLFLL
jgi:hypothetical protein